MHHFKKTHKNDNSKRRIKQNVSRKAGARRQKGGVFNFLRTQRQKDNILFKIIKDRSLHVDDAAAARIAIQNGANVNAKDSTNEFGYTPLIYAVNPYMPNVTALLIEKGADVNATNSKGLAPLHLALWHPEIALLLEKGADVNARDANGYTPLLRAIDRDRDNMREIQLLIDNGADVNTPNSYVNTPLIHAIYRTHYELTRLLIENGADVNATDSNGKTLLNLAIKKHLNEIAALLLEKEGMIMKISHAMDAIEIGNANVLTLMIDKGFDIKNEGQTYLKQAIDNCLNVTPNTKIVDILLTAGVGVDDETIDYARREASRYAGWKGYKKVVKMLEEALPPPPPSLCMSQADYDKCDKNNDGEVIDPLLLEPVIRNDAVKLKGQPNVCYNRASLKQWTKNSKTNPFTREPIGDDWIKSNLKDGECQEPTTGGAGKRKRTRKTLKKRKSNKK
jgi:ankyrin repeat protein